jgi:peptide/nickel transport system substrate-binding protein
MTTTGSGSLSPLTRRQLLERGGGALTGVSLASVLAACGASGVGPSTGTGTGGGSPHLGGTLKIGMIGGGSSETIDPNKANNEVDIARVYQLYERLVGYDNSGAPVNQLAAEFSPNKTATQWKMKLRPDVKFHDGSPLTADDVVYSLQYALTHKASGGYSDAKSAFLTPKGIKAIDKTTVQFDLDAPNAVLPTSLSARTLWIFKAGMTDFSKPNGTGPFKYQSFHVGQESVFSKHDEYRESGQPYLDAVQITSFSDPSANFHALQSNVIDAMANIDFSFIKLVKSNPSLRLLISPQGGGTTTFTMRTDIAPFNDARVRQAFRLLVDRDQLVSNALDGQATVGNDLFWPADPDYASSIPQRMHDPEKAKALLKAAGQSDLTVPLYTSTIEVGMLSAATILQAEAAKIGVKVTFDKVASDIYYSNKYLKAPFGQSGWSLRPLLTQWAQLLEYNSPYNETHWHDAKFEALATQAQKTLDADKRKSLMQEAQQVQWDEGGYIVWGIYKNVDAYSPKIQGLQPANHRWLGGYNFRTVSVA